MTIAAVTTVNHVITSYAYACSMLCKPNKYSSILALGYKTIVYYRL